MEICNVDICLSDYVLDHCNGDHELLLGVYVDSSTRMHNVKSDLLSEIDRLDTDKPGFDYDEARAAVVAAFAGTHPLKTFCRTLERSDPDDEAAEAPQAWWRLSWEAPDA